MAQNSKFTKQISLLSHLPSQEQPLFAIFYNSFQSLGKSQCQHNDIILLWKLPESTFPMLRFYHVPVSVFFFLVPIIILNCYLHIRQVLTLFFFFSNARQWLFYRLLEALFCRVRKLSFWLDFAYCFSYPVQFITYSDILSFPDIINLSKKKITCIACQELRRV